MLLFICHLITQCYHSHRKVRINLHSFLIFTHFERWKIRFLSYSDMMNVFFNIIIKSWGFDPFQFYFYWNRNFSIFGQWEFLWVCSWILPTWLQWSAVAYQLILDISCSESKSAISPKIQRFSWCDVFENKNQVAINSLTFELVIASRHLQWTELEVFTNVSTQNQGCLVFSHIKNLVLKDPGTNRIGILLT